MQKVHQDLIVFYDGWCPICLKAKTKIEKNDKQHQIKLLSIRDPVIYKHYDLSGKNVEERIYSVRKSDGKAFSGIHTILEIAKRLPKYKIFVPLLYMSIVLGLGQKVYDYIASKREIVPVGKCKDETCTIHYKEE
ncbi:Predicted thiol-disulfide oxidoreductase YuxK, DCC family [Salinibacillus kushneri]|uniref:Predicted thiol-disulfide oxidoreductase YuxK, DCC family n=1 Tax=Salinibacillus kushneri TaxID=237682 RepID=A0A1I0E2G2_9BACI|nr:DUF393 domain-containing protein [Salinibacillus kushneri]SET39271.1 Predicted thiol-disulfide oxidoreductase YuxK, DCC family [Salinibacillus kushneri]